MLVVGCKLQMMLMVADPRWDGEGQCEGITGSVLQQARRDWPLKVYTNMNVPLNT